MNTHYTHVDENSLYKTLLPRYKKGEILPQQEKEQLLNYLAVNESLLGLIGLLTHNLPRIIVGKTCTNAEIKAACRKVKHSLNDLEEIADIYLEQEHSEADEYVFRTIMLKYPKTGQNE